MGLKDLSLLVLLVCAASLSRRCDAALAPALFVFGDSTVDTGSSVISPNYAPYGIDFTPPGPTGRFCNGKVANDFIAEYLGLPFPINFVDPKATGPVLQTGVNFAFSGSGYLDIGVPLPGVLNLTKQVEALATVQANIIQQLGVPATTSLISQAVFLISTGNNDFANNYDISPSLQQSYNPSQYQQLVLDSVNTNLQSLYNMGARKVVIVSMGPVGCAPAQLVLHNSKDGKCLDSINAALLNFNVGLKSLVFQLRSQYPDYNLLYSNAYDPLMSFISNPTGYGYIAEASNTACCGEGAWKGLPCANPVSDLCADRDQYIFWDFFHPTQKTYQSLANGIINGDSNTISPSNLQAIL